MSRPEKPGPPRLARWLLECPHPENTLEEVDGDLDEPDLPRRFQLHFNIGYAVVTGKGFSREFSTDSAGVILNETAVKAMGWEKNPLRRELVGQTDDDATPDHTLLHLTIPDHT